ncbi:MAG TPA: hypothetical protein VFP05_18310 [Thermomicrobiales bacterium]|nr:hypothetical protein [Thermomicrobiales bacterium]
MADAAGEVKTSIRPIAVGMPVCNGYESYPTAAALLRFLPPVQLTGNEGIDLWPTSR